MKQSQKGHADKAVLELFYGATPCDCGNAIQLILLKSLVDFLGAKAFNQRYPLLTLPGPWMDGLLQTYGNDPGYTRRLQAFRGKPIITFRKALGAAPLPTPIPGDIRVFLQTGTRSPLVLLRENSLYLGGDYYFAFGLVRKEAIYTRPSLMRILNSTLKPGVSPDQMSYEGQFSERLIDLASGTP
jgi:hypothetical protein